MDPRREYDGGADDVSEPFKLKFKRNLICSLRGDLGFETTVPPETRRASLTA